MDNGNSFKREIQGLGAAGRGWGAKRDCNRVLNVNQSYANENALKMQIILPQNMCARLYSHCRADRHFVFYPNFRQRSVNPRPLTPKLFCEEINISAHCCTFPAFSLLKPSP